MTQDKQTQMARQIANEIGAAPTQVLAAVALLDAGSTVPLWRATEKRLRAGLMTRSCATFPSGWAICASLALGGA